MSSLEELKYERELLNRKDKAILNNMDMIIQENYRVANVAHNASHILDNLDSEFENLTGLNNFDIKFLFFATALQCIRQYLLSNEKFRFDKASDADKLINKPLKSILDKSNVKKDYKDILLGGVPYDIIPSKAWGTNLSGKNHRELTLGHDPVFGWLFGTVNIMTSSLTIKDALLSSYIVNTRDIEIFSNFPELFLQSMELFEYDNKLLIAAVTKQAIHYASDTFTKSGISLPIINNIAPDFNSILINNNIDSYSVTRGVLATKFLNAIIAVVHGFYYDESKYPSRDIYKVKTRKIISYSNAMASASNVINVAIRACLNDKKALTKLDVGGIMTTLNRLINDYNFIREVKEEFIFGNFNKQIDGDDYNFQLI